MNRFAVPLLACVLGCGRMDFGEVTIDADAVDKCPHIPGSTADSDGDGVGDACDPHPDTPGDHIGLYSPLTPGTSPFDETTGFTEGSDGLHISGDTSIGITRPFGTARIEVGFASTPLYSAGNRVHYSLNGLELVLRYIIVIDSP